MIKRFLFVLDSTKKVPNVYSIPITQEKLAEKVRDFRSKWVIVIPVLVHVAKNCSTSCWKCIRRYKKQRQSHFGSGRCFMVTSISSITNSGTSIPSRKSRLKLCSFFDSITRDKKLHNERNLRFLERCLPSEILLSEKKQWKK